MKTGTYFPHGEYLIDLYASGLWDGDDFVNLLESNPLRQDETFKSWAEDKAVVIANPDPLPVRPPFTNFERNVQAVFDEARELLLDKNKDYGSRNISDSPGGPLNGLLVRMWDKMARLRNLAESGADPQNESVRDSYKDLANYAIIALLVIDEKWPKE